MADVNRAQVVSSYVAKRVHAYVWQRIPVLTARLIVDRVGRDVISFAAPTALHWRFKVRALREHLEEICEPHADRD